VRGDCIHPQRGQVIHRCAKTDALSNRRGASLELVRQVIGLETFEGDFLDHIAAAQERRHRCQQALLAIQGTDPRRPAHLMRREGHKVGVQGAHIHGKVRHRLGAIDESQRAGFMRHANDLLRRGNGSQYIRHVSECHQFWLQLEQVLIGIHIEQEIWRNGDELELNTLFGCQYVPGHDI